MCLRKHQAGKQESRGHRDEFHARSMSSIAIRARYENRAALRMMQCDFQRARRVHDSITTERTAAITTSAASLSIFGPLATYSVSQARIRSRAALSLHQ